MPFRLFRTAIETPSADELAALRDEYERTNCVLLPSFLDARVVAWLQDRMSGAWTVHVHEDVVPPSTDLMLDDEVALGVLIAMTHVRPVFETVRAITGCDPIGSYGFRIYRMDPGPEHADTWHTDDNGNRMVTLSIDVSPRPFEGGALEIRDSKTRRVLHHVRNARAGDAILFRIGSDLEHRVGEVTGAAPKCAVAGWFLRRPWAASRPPSRPA